MHHSHWLIHLPHLAKHADAYGSVGMISMGIAILGLLLFLAQKRSSLIGQLLCWQYVLTLILPIALSFK